MSQTGVDAVHSSMSVRKESTNIREERQEQEDEPEEEKKKRGRRRRRRIMLCNDEHTEKDKKDVISD